MVEAAKGTALCAGAASGMLSTDRAVVGAVSGCGNLLLRVRKAMRASTPMSNTMAERLAKRIRSRRRRWARRSNSARMTLDGMVWSKWEG